MEASIEPQVRYTTTSDGTKIAFVVGGEGSQVVCMPFHHNHVERRWRKHLWIQGLTGEHRVLAYDSRGQGLSARDLTSDPTPEDYVSDLDAAIGAAGFEDVVLVAFGGFSHVAIRYAHAHPETVRALILLCTSEAYSAWPQAFFVSLAKENWDLFLELQLSPDTPPEMKEIYLNYLRASSTQGDYLRMVRCFHSSTVADLIPHIRVPTLLLHSRTQHWLSPEEGARQAAKIPGARLVFIDGNIEPDEVQGVRTALEFMRDLPVEVPIAPDVPDAPALSARQAQVLELVAKGRTSREIAVELVLSERTVQRHIADVYARIGVRNRAEATAFVLRHASRAPIPAMGISAQ
jgi:pimeloyl-ACP methyl ester carboxylesterase/DNA-binding CsgD family transcriptional regulator